MNSAPQDLGGTHTKAGSGEKKKGRENIVPTSPKKKKGHGNIVPAPPSLSADVAFDEPSGNRVLDAEETGAISVTVRNGGNGDAFEVTASVSADGPVKGLSFDPSLSFDTIPAGKSETRKVSLKAAKGVETGTVKLTLAFSEWNGFPPESVIQPFMTQALVPPDLVVASVGVDDFNKNRKIEPGETAVLTVRIHNRGHGEARKVTADVVVGENVFLGGGETRFDLGTLAPGAYRDITFPVWSNKKIRDSQPIPVSIRLTEARPRFSVERPLQLVMSAPQRDPMEMPVPGKAGVVAMGSVGNAPALDPDVDRLVPSGEAAGPYDVAIVIGNRDYRATAPVEFAKNDAAIVKEYLLHAFGFKPGNILYEEDATLATFFKLFGTPGNPKGRVSDLVNRKPGVASVFVYYSGHGAPDPNSGEAYLVPSDGEPDYLSSGGYRLRTLYKNLGALPARTVTIVLDSCFSGKSGDGKTLFKNISPGVLVPKGAYQAPANALLIASARENQVSNWYPEMHHSLFTYYFLKALQGDADVNEDRAITVGELRRYLSENVPIEARARTSRDQDPVIQGMGDEHVLLRLKKK
ncbi:MAG: caspase family protein [Candidatus Deferrimicrobium sp.]